MNEHGSSFDKDYEPSASIMELEKPEQNLKRASKDVFSLTSSAIKVRNIITTQSINNTGKKQQQYKGCWGIVESLHEQRAYINVCGEVVEYFLTDINPIKIRLLP